MLFLTTTRTAASLLFCIIMSASALAPRIAIIGAGSSGLAAARVFSRNGIEPVVLEKDRGSGGVWRYEKGSKTRPMYRGLRTNLPKEIMQFRELPFSDVEGFATDASPSFLTHRKVQEYLLAYQTRFGLSKFIRYGCEVCKLEIVKDSKSPVSPSTEDWPQIRLEWREESNAGDATSEETAATTTTTKSEIFDAVCICNGHYSKPANVNIPGLKEHFGGRVMHAIEYDDPAEFQGQKVLCVGGRASGSDLAREIGAFASHVFLSDSTCKVADGQEPETRDNITWVPKTVGIHQDGTVQFEGCRMSPLVDCIILCTGYDYDFPFLQGNDVQSAPGERRVMPLYEQLWHAQYPTLSFLGIPHSVVPFPEVEFQAEAVHAQYVSNQLPSLQERTLAAEKDAVSGGPKENGRVPQDTHYLGGAQWDYCKRLAKLAGIYNQTVADYIATNQMIYQHAWEGRNLKFPAGPDTYREIDYVRNEGKPGFTIKARS